MQKRRDLEVRRSHLLETHIIRNPTQLGVPYFHAQHTLHIGEPRLTKTFLKLKQLVQSEVCANYLLTGYSMIERDVASGQPGCAGVGKFEQVGWGRILR